MQTLKGRTCVFSGASAGDGVEAVKTLCAGGMNVVMLTHQLETAQRLIGEIRSMDLPGECIALAGGGDATPERDAAVYERVFRRFGSLDVVISNTGATGKATPMEEVTGEQLMKNIEHLVSGAFDMLINALSFCERAARPVSY